MRWPILLRVIVCPIIYSWFFLPGLLMANTYAWPTARAGHDTIQQRFPEPAGFRRVSQAQGSFATWLRGLPLKRGRSAVRLYNGNLKPNQSAHLAVISIDAGRLNLQQCADAIIRLRAEYFFARGQYQKIHFNFTDGVPAHYSDWRNGLRPVVKQPRTIWRREAPPDKSYKGFRKYLNKIFIYAGTYSLSQESQRVKISQLRIGDFFIKGGFPGHAVLVADLVVHPTTGQKRFMLLQSYMPAQEIHILKNPFDGSAWYKLPQKELHTPEWVFQASELKRF